VEILPFQIDRASSVDLALQVEKGLSGAIHSGVYRPGDRLPGIHDMARDLGVSNVVVSRAVRRLSAAGKLQARRRAGIHVTQGEQPFARGHVLLVDATSASYFFGTRSQALTQALQDANLRVSSLFYTDLGDEAVCQRLALALDSQAVSLVLLAVPVAGAVAICQSRGVPHVACLAKDAAPGADGPPVAVVRYSDTAAMRDMVAHILALNVRHIHAISIHAQALETLTSLAKTAGLTVSVETALDWQKSGAEGYEMVGFSAAQHLLARGPLPDLLFVPDDYLARGVLTALLLAGKRVPVDVQLVAAVNRGAHPAYTGPFTRVENDPVEHGQVLAQAILGALDRDESEPPLAFRLGPSFVAGSTTCPLSATVS
jgi:DNA-binding LacI/PurR family transcriptional regulator